VLPSEASAATLLQSLAPELSFETLGAGGFLVARLPHAAARAKLRLGRAAGMARFMACYRYEPSAAASRPVTCPKRPGKSAVLSAAWRGNSYVVELADGGDALLFSEQRPARAEVDGVEAESHWHDGRLTLHVAGDGRHELRVTL
jgi:hypothetical protein